MIEHAEALGCRVVCMECGANIIDMGVHVKGSWDAGVLLAKIMMGNLANVTLGTFQLNENYSFASVNVYMENPDIACAASQLAGWEIAKGSHEYAVIGSGPARAQAAMPGDRYIHQTTYRDSSTEHAIICIQGTEYPGEEIALEISRACNVAPEHVYIVIAANTCVATSVQVSARVIEQTSHLLVDNGVSLSSIVMGRASAPIAPVVLDETKMMGRINDALIYGSEAEYWVDMEDAEIERVINHMVALSSHPRYGELYEEAFIRANRNFYEVEEAINTIAKIQMHNVRSGKSFCAGEINYNALERSFLQ